MGVALICSLRALTRDGGCLIASAGARPAGAPFALRDLVSRFAALAPYRLQPPDDDTRLAALLLRAENRGLVLDTAAAKYLLRRLPRDLPRLFSLVAAARCARALFISAA